MDGLKATVVGDGAVGKTCLLLAYTTGQVPGDYVPTIFDNYSQSVMVDGKLTNLSMWDTAGQEDYDRLRPLSYPSTDVFVACFSTVNPSSMNNLRIKWVEEIREHAGNGVPVLIVGTKTDMRNDPEVNMKLASRMQHPITTAEGQEFAKSVGAAGYVECSAITSDGVKECFENAVRVARVSRMENLRLEKRSRSRMLRMLDFFTRVGGGR
jgi:Ras-related C3 botulinum toxin substrate 1